MKIRSDIYQALLRIPAVPPESGGILFADQSQTVAHAVFDAGTPCMERAVYTPNTEFLNQQIAQLCKQELVFCGIFHSHPSDQKGLSEQDVSYLRRIMRSLPQWVERLYAPIVLPNSEVIPYSVYRCGDIRGEPLQIVSWKEVKHNGKQDEEG